MLYYILIILYLHTKNNNNNNNIVLNSFQKKLILYLIRFYLLWVSAFQANIEAKNEILLSLPSKIKIT